jgi:transcriptional regulator with XRE-family HTH domain
MIGERIRERLSARHLSQSELARRVDLTQGTIAGLLSGRSRSSAHLHKIARALGTTPAYLSGETDDPESHMPSPPVLDRDEWAWVEYWRALDDSGRDAMVRVVKLLTGKIVENVAISTNKTKDDDGIIRV